MRSLSLAVLLGLVIAQSMGVAAQGGQAEYRFESLDRLRVQLDDRQEGDEAADSRTQIDRAGDGDGTVTEDEVRSAERSFLNLTRRFGDRNSTANMRLEGNLPSNLSFEDVTITGAEGDAQSTAALSIRLLIIVRFPATQAKEPRLEVQHDNQSAQDVARSLLIAPPGYRIKSTTGLPSGASISDNRSEIRFAGPMNPPEAMTITFSDRSAAQAPGALVWVLVLAAVVVAAGGVVLLLRARRHP